MSPARPTAAVARDGQPARRMELLPADIVAEIIARACPTDPGEVLAGVVWALKRSLALRADGSRHLDSCRNARVNSQMFECSRDCERAQIALVWGQTWLGANVRRAEAPRQLRLEAV